MDSVTITIGSDDLEYILQQVGRWETTEIADFINKLGMSINNAKSNYEYSSCRDIAEKLDYQGKLLVTYIYKEINNENTQLNHVSI